jgi:uncharacterized protein with GYD domain
VTVPTYIALLNWTEQGIRDYRDSPARADAFGSAIEGLGGKLQSFHWTIGPYDMVATIDAPDDETVTAAMLKVGSLGNVRTTTMRTFDRTQMAAIFAK